MQTLLSLLVNILVATQEVTLIILVDTRHALFALLYMFSAAYRAVDGRLPLMPLR